MRLHWVLLFTVFMGSCINERPTRFDHTSVEEEVPSDDQPEVVVQNRHIWQQPSLILDRLEPLEGKTIADLGAGTGYFAFRFLKRNARVFALEIDPKMIELIKKEATFLPDSLSSRLQTRLVQTDNSGLSAGEVDIIFVANTYCYIDDRVSYFTNLKSVFRKDGVLAIVDFKKKNTPMGPPLEQRLSLGVVESELNAAGYEIVESDDTSLEFQYILLARPNQ